MTSPTAWAPSLLSVLRIITGLLFLEHGTTKVLSFPYGADAHTALPLDSLHALSGWLELIGGLLIVLGLFTRVTAFILSGEMAVAYFMAHSAKSFYPELNHGELAVLYCFVFLYLAAAGAGPWSIDANRRRSGTRGR